MADLGERSKKDDAKREFKRREHGRTLYKDKKAGDQIVFTVLDKWYHVQQMVYPALNEEQESVGFVRLTGKYWNHNAKGKVDMERNFIKGGDEKRSQAEGNLVMLANYVLEQYRLFAQKLYEAQGKSAEEARKLAIDKIDLSIGYGKQAKKFWSKASEEWGTLATINGEVIPFPIKAVTYDPIANARGDAGYYRDNLKPDTKVAVLMEAEFTPNDFSETSGDLSTNQKLAKLFELNRGIKQFNEEIVEDKQGNKFFRYPPFITEFILSAQQSRKANFGDHYLVWRPQANLHEDYQFFLPAEYENPLGVHPEDANIVRAFLALPKAKRQATPPPKYRSYPSQDGLLVYVSMDNPSLPPTKAINVFEGSLGERFTPDMIEKIAEYGEYHGFRANTQEGLLGGYFYDYPSYDYEIEAAIMGETLKAKGKTDPRRIYVQVKEDFGFKMNAENAPEITVDGHKTTLEWSQGVLHAKPVNLDSSYLMRILMEKGLIKTNNVASLSADIDAVTADLKEKATELEIPFVGGQKSEPYSIFKNRPEYSQLLAYHESKGKRGRESGDSEESEVPANMQAGKDIGL